MSCKFALFAAAIAGLTLPTLSVATAQQFATPPAYVFSAPIGVFGDGRDAPRSYAIAACARRFHSFNANTGTYTAHSGEQVLCPYLRG